MRKIPMGFNRLVPLCATLLLAAAAPPDSPVADAARQRDLDTVRELIQQGADINAPHGDGMTALHWAAINGDAPLMELLLDSGADVAAVTRLAAHTPLHIAAKEAAAPLVRLLLEGGADPAARTSSGVTPLHQAALGGSAEVAEALLEHGAEVDAREWKWEQTPLVFATATNRLEVMKALLAHGAEHSGYTRLVSLNTERAVDRAGQQARDDVLDAFREESGVDRNTSWQPTASQVQAAVLAAHEAQQAELEAMEEADAASVDGITQGGMTPLLHAAREGHIEAAMMLLDAGADIHQTKLVDGYAPLLMAIINGHYDLALALVDRGADPNQAAASDGVAPLWAVINNFWGAKTRYPQPQNQHYQNASYLEAMEALLVAGADPDHGIEDAPFYLQYTFGSLGVDFSGATAFFRAAHTVDVAAMRLLVAYGADHTLPTLVTPRGGRGAPAPTESVEPQPGVLPIHAAAGVSYGRSYTANFHLHAPNGWMPAMRYLVEELGHDVNAVDADGYTPLHHAASRGDNDMILYLVDKGADVTAVSGRGQTTVDMANGPGQRITPFPATIALLESLGAKNNHRCVSC